MSGKPKGLIPPMLPNIFTDLCSFFSSTKVDSGQSAGAEQGKIQVRTKVYGNGMVGGHYSSSADSYIGSRIFYRGLETVPTHLASFCSLDEPALLLYQIITLGKLLF